MRTCTEIEPLVTPYVDGEVGQQGRAAIEAHLALCRPCRERAAVERTARTVVRARTGLLAARASNDLRTRCAAATQPAPARPALARARRAWIPLSMAATLLLAVGGVFIYGLTSRLGAALAAQLTLDHVKCFALADPQASPASPDRVESSLLANYGWHMKVPASSRPEHLQLLGARRCLYHEGQMAHVMYRRDGRPVSLFILPNRTGARHVLEMMGHEAIIWSIGGKTYALVGREPPAEMARIATYVRDMSR